MGTLKLQGQAELERKWADADTIAALRSKVQRYEEALLRLNQIHDWQHLSDPNVVADEVADIAADALESPK